MGGGVVPAAEIRHHKPAVEQRRDHFLRSFLAEIESKLFWGEINVSPEGNIAVTPRPLLELCFTIYDPKNIGLIDYHSANRTYNRESVGGINLSIDSSEQMYKNHTLYNSSHKYSNVKSEMASAYVRQLLAKEVDGIAKDEKNVISTLQELFRIFFPGKKFIGPTPTKEGNLHFPVELIDGGTHDINELSSGEKEVLYGYLRLQNTSPHNSILLLDEPELHLNPRLIKGLPKFYQKYIGLQHNNQIWLVTHSDAFLRETVGEPGFSVFHMKSSNTTTPEKQIQRIRADNEIEAAFIDLVGDLATYSPNSNVIIFEGGGDSDFDVKMVNSLFPEISELANIISGESKYKVKTLHKLLDKATEKQRLPYRFYSVVDRDSELTPEKNKNHFQWDVYHIENYLLEPKYILQVLQDIGHTKEYSIEEINTILKECAQKCIQTHTIMTITKNINSDIVSKLSIRINPKSREPANEAFHSLISSVTQINDLINSKYSSEQINIIEENIRKDLLQDAAGDSWKTNFKGRDIIKYFIDTIGIGVKYEVFRNLIIARMRSDGYQPPGMKRVIELIIEDMKSYAPTKYYQHQQTYQPPAIARKEF